MTQDDPAGDQLERRTRDRIRALRTARGWSLDELARRTLISPSTLSRIETGHRRIAIDQLGPIARALETTIDELLTSPDPADVVIRPIRDTVNGKTVWPLSRRDDSGVIVTKMRLPANRKREPDQRVHPGREWFYVLAGTMRLTLDGREILVEAGQAAEFSTMSPHSLSGFGGSVEIIGIFDRHGERAHLTPTSGATR
jgi:transcriptional regulator with XRE-family HTH domain